MNTNVIAEIIAIIVMVIFFALVSGELALGTVRRDICDKKTEKEKYLIRYMGDALLIIMSLVVCISVCMHFEVMVCFGILVPTMIQSIEDALCATTYIEIIIKYVLLLLFSTGFVLILASFHNEGILENDIVRAMILIAVFSVPIKSFVDLFYTNTGDTKNGKV